MYFLVFAVNDIIVHIHCAYRCTAYIKKERAFQFLHKIVIKIRYYAYYYYYGMYCVNLFEI